MSLLPREAIKAVSPELSDKVADELLKDVEFRLRTVVEEALKFMHHSKRQVLSTDDINQALKAMDAEPLYGYNSLEPPLLKNAAGASDQFHYEDQEVDLAEIIQAPLPKCPPEVTYTAHWLAIEGVQPSIPQNPPTYGEDRPMIQRTSKESVIVNAAGQPVSAALGAGLPLAPAAPATTPLAAAAHALDNKIRDVAEIKPLVKHTLSKELQIYYERIVDAITGSEEAPKKAAFSGLSSDPGLHQLLPYLSQFIADKVLQSLHNLPVLTSLMQMVKALATNPVLHLEPYLHQIMPVVLTCVLGKRLCLRHTDDHWSLRVLAAQVVALICRRYSTAHNQLQPRTAKTMVKVFLDAYKPLTSHFGAIVGLEHLGAESITALVLPNFAAYVSLLDRKRDASNPENTPAVRQEADRVHGALLSAVGNLLRHKSIQYTPTGLKPDMTLLVSPEVQAYYDQVYGYFGTALIPYCTPSVAPATATPALAPGGGTSKPADANGPTAMAL